MNTLTNTDLNFVVRRIPKDIRDLLTSNRKAGPGGRVTASDWAKVLDILGTHCLCCGSDAAPTQDHIVPLAKGGRHHPENLQPLCRPCNERKQARTMDYRTPEQITAIAAVWCVSFKRMETA